MYGKILVPVDGSATSNRGLEEAIRLAKDQGSTLYLLHVVEEYVLTQSVDAGRIAIDRLLAELREAGAAILAASEKKVVQAGVRCQPILEESVSNRVADIIVERAKQLAVDLIALGTHGRRGLRRIVLGSDAEIVLRYTPVPILLVRSNEEESSA
jgi:nucleotide-binding universal stress UspA family protein